MTQVVIQNNDRDFTDVASALVRQELGITCHIAENEKQAGQWPGALVIVPENPPVRMRMILEKIRTFRASTEKDETLTFGQWALSPRLKTLSRGGLSIGLTDKETQLLQCMIEAGKRGIERDVLLKQVWGMESGINTHTLETHIYRLRGKLRELEGDELIAATGGGYRLEYKP